MSVTVIATFIPVPEHRGEVIAALEQTIVTVHASPALAELTERIDGKLVGAPDVRVLDPHPAGTVQQGTL